MNMNVNVPDVTIATSAVLVEVNVSGWTATKLDKKISDEVDMDKGTLVKAGRFNKDILAGSKELEDTKKIASRIRAWVNMETLPWSDNGLRLLPTAKLWDFKAAMNNWESMYNDAVDSLITAYPNLIQVASMNLAGAFNPNDYPTIESVSSKFNIRTTFSKIPDSDFRVDIGHQANTMLREQYEQAMHDRLVEANRAVWERLYTIAARFANQLREDGKIYASTFEQLSDLTEMMHAYNVTNDPELALRAREIKSIVECTCPEELKEDKLVRSQVKQEVQDILNKFSF